MTPVAIAGGGPTGLALALTLARRGVATTVFDQRTAPTPLDESRAITWMPGGLAFLDWAGITADFTRIGIRRHAHEFWSPRGPLLIVRYDRPAHRHPYTLMLPQHHTERLLAEAATGTRLVEIRRGHRVVEAAQDAEAAVLSVDDGGRTYRYRASWAVAADGAGSAVRKSLDIGQRWRDHRTDTAVADFDLDCDLPPDRSRMVLDPRRPYGFFPFAPGRWRLVYRINSGEDRSAMATAGAAAGLLAQVLPTARIHRFLWASAFRLGQGQSTSYRRGRWLLVGDAAHAMGPSAGAGMMIGVLGAWRLGLRLTETLGGGSTEPLDRYAEEQRAAADRVQRDNARIFANIAVRSTAVAAIRAAGLRFAGRRPAVVTRMARSEALLHLPPVHEGAERTDANGRR
jgi:2-polyprenyl-6-methoxyphenol hydroxylase-like FAD-dependent oxidoreductase